MPIKLKGLNEASEPVTTPFPTVPLETGCKWPTPRTFNDEKYYGTDDVAKIIGVTRRTVSNWHAKGWFIADERAHDGRYLYTVEHVEQLKSVYRPDWREPAYLAHVTDEAICNGTCANDHYPSPTTSNVTDEVSSTPSTYKRGANVDIEKFALINKIDVGTLSGYGLLTATKRSKNGNPSRFKCPFCGSHELTPYAGKDFVQWRCDCFGDDFKRNEDLLAKVFGLDVDADKAEIYRRVKEKMPNFDKPTESMITSNVNVGMFADGTPTENNPKTDGDISIEQQIVDDIDIANGGFEDLPVEEKRGIRDETARRLKIGAIKSWYHPKMPNTPTTTRFICRLGDDTDQPSYNAILTPAERRRVKPLRERYEKQDKKPPKWTDKSLTANCKLVFNPNAIDDNDGLLCVLEGEFDCASIVQATNFQVAACALGGAGLFKDFEARLSKLNNPPKVIVLFDRDAVSQTGQNESAKLVAELAEMRLAAVAKFFEDVMSDDELKIFGGKVDANEILQKRGDEFLADIINRIIDSSKAELDALAEKFAAEKSSPEFKDVSPEIFHDKKSRPKNLSPEINALLEAVNGALDSSNVLHYVDKARISGLVCPNCGSGSNTHGTGALKFFYKPSPHVACYKCRFGADALKLFAMKHGRDTTGKNFFETLRAAADEFGVKYDPKIFELPTRPLTVEDHMTGDKEIDDWQKVNGVIHPELLADLKTAAAQITAFEAVTAAQANDTSLLKCLGVMQYYSPFGHVTRQFLIKLADAKNAAKKKIALHKKDESAPEPTDEEKELATVNITFVNQEIKKNRQLAEKKHKKYVQTARQQEIANKRNEQRNSNIINPVTTKTNVPDCPIELVLPENITFDETGIKLTEINNNGEEITIEACQNPIVPTKILRESSSNVTQYEVAIKTECGWCKIIADGQTLQDGRSISKICNYGAHITENRATAKFFAKLIAINEKNGYLPTVRVFNKPGWHGDEFIYPATKNVDYVVIRNGIDYNSIFAEKGDAREWLKKFDFVTHPKANQHALKRAIIGAGLVAPLIKILDIMNPQFHIEGTSSYAKSLLPKFALSVFGDPNEGGMLRSWNSSSKNRQTMAVGYCDFPQAIDELESLKKADLPVLSKDIYDFSTGLVNQANKRNGDVRTTEVFRSVRLSTGERGMLTESDKRGAFKRLVTLFVGKPLFNDRDARNFHIFLKNNYGHFGREWVAYIQAHKAEIRTMFDGIYNDFSSNGFDDGKGKIAAMETIDATNALAIIACFVAVKHFRFMTKLDQTLDESKDLIELASDISEMFAQLPTTKEMSDPKRFINLLASWVAANPKRFNRPKRSPNGTPIDDDEGYASQSYAPTVGKIKANGDIAFYPHAFREICNELDIPSHEKFLNDLFDAGLLDCRDRRSKFKTVRNEEGRSVSAYVLINGALDPEEPHDDADC